jgi:hypothetical protein
MVSLNTRLIKKNQKKNLKENLVLEKKKKSKNLKEI